MKLQATMPIVSAIVPARDEEENISRAIESLAIQDPIGEIIVVNDQSTDHTAQILAEISAADDRFRILETRELPAGWVGKNYALSLGAAEAQGKWLLFTDADAMHLPGSTARALELAEKTEAALISFSPEQETSTWWERAMIPFVFSRLADKFRYNTINDPNSPAAAANGQYLLIRRDAYDAIGGHRAIAAEVLEDVEIAKRVKAAGLGIYFAPGKGIARVRMYRTFGAMWQGWVKNLYPLMAGSRGRFLLELATTFPWIPVALLLMAPLHWIFPMAGLALLLGRHAAYGGVLRANHFPLSGIKYYFPAVVLYCAALTVSAWRYSRGKVVWKGREYRVGMVSK
jgi:glycosyltransferase involved in cell wall biosynthesis